MTHKGGLLDLITVSFVEKLSIHNFVINGRYFGVVKGKEPRAVVSPSGNSFHSFYQF